MQQCLYLPIVQQCLYLPTELPRGMRQQRQLQKDIACCRTLLWPHLQQSHAHSVSLPRPPLIPHPFSVPLHSLDQILTTAANASLQWYFREPGGAICFKKEIEFCGETGIPQAVLKAAKGPMHQYEATYLVPLVGFKKNNPGDMQGW